MYPTESTKKLMRLNSMRRLFINCALLVFTWNIQGYATTIVPVPRVQSVTRATVAKKRKKLRL